MIALTAVLITLSWPPLEQGGQPSTSGTEREIRSLVESAIGLLEKRRYEQFLQQCVSPSERSRRDKESGGSAQSLQKFAESDEPARLLRLLTASRQAKFAVGRNEAGFFVLAPPVDGESRLALSRHKKKWYLY